MLLLMLGIVIHKRFITSWLKIKHDSYLLALQVNFVLVVEYYYLLISDVWLTIQEKRFKCVYKRVNFSFLFKMSRVDWKWKSLH